jgi:hypothetical protein
MNKSAYMVINGLDAQKHDLQIGDKCLKYQARQTYLGAIITDTGNLTHDIMQHSKSKQPSVSIKLTNFIRNNKYCPVWIKLKVLTTCVNSSLLYGCETWSNNSIDCIEKLHRKGLKIVLGVRDNTPNDILYAETGHYPLISSIRARQYIFWTGLCKDKLDNPESQLSIFIGRALDQNISFITYYHKLHMDYSSPRHVSTSLNSAFQLRLHDCLTSHQTIDPQGKLGTYARLNPTFGVSRMYEIASHCETERILLTKYRTGSHSLRIESGRWTRTPREARFCECGPHVQTLDHVVMNCSALNNHRINTHDSLSFFSLTLAHRNFC